MILFEQRHPLPTGLINPTLRPASLRVDRRNRGILMTGTPIFVHVTKNKIIAVGAFAFVCHK